MAGATRPAHSLTDRIAGLRSLTRVMAVAIVVFILAAYAAVYAVTANVLRGSLRAQAASYAGLIKTTRAWNAMHGGVYVEKSDDATTNPYLVDLGITADVEDVRGRTLTLRNPSAMTREISNLTRRGSGVTFRLTSQKAVNPDALPDPWEETALRGFARAPDPAATLETTRGVTHYRYMVPLYVEQSCLQCHGSQGYRVGDLRGGLAVTVPYAATAASLRLSAWVLAALAVLTSLFVVLTFSAALGHYRKRLTEAGEALARIAMIDPLTSVGNRRTAMERLDAEMERARRTKRPLSVVALDIDHFKRVNDSAGHAAGDEVLREAARRLAETVREYDIVARTGGEEFVVIAPETDAEECLALAERLLDAVRARPIETGGGGFDVTMSAGVASMLPDEDIDALLGRADEALYRSKAAGRDRAAAS